MVGCDYILAGFCGRARKSTQRARFRSSGLLQQPVRMGVKIKLFTPVLIVRVENCLFEFASKGPMLWLDHLRIPDHLEGLFVRVEKKQVTSLKDQARQVPSSI